MDPTHQKKPLIEALEGAGQADSEADRGEVELFCMKIGGAAFAVETGLIHEVVRVPPTTPLPGSPSFLEGVAAHRGDVLAVVDLARLLGRGDTRLGARSRMAVARWDSLQVGLLADEVIGLARYPASALQPAPLGTEGSEFISGIVFGGNSLNILDLRRALQSARERVAARK